MIVHLNGRSLDALYEALKDNSVDGEPEARLMQLGERYIDFTRRHQSRWNLLFEHHLPDGRELPDWHYVKIFRLLNLAEAALAPLFPEGRERERMHSARVLWSALHGICSLESSRNLAKNESVEALTRTLILFYVKGLSNATRKGQYE